MNECQKLLHADLETAFASNPQAAWERFKMELRGDIAVFFDFLIGKQEFNMKSREEIQACLLDAEAEAASAAVHNEQQHTRKPARAAGFSIIELLVVVAIILIIAAIAVPKLLSARAASQETAAA